MHRDTWNELFRSPSGPRWAGWVAPTLVVSAVLGVAALGGGGVSRSPAPPVAAPPPVSDVPAATPAPPVAPAPVAPAPPVDPVEPVVVEPVRRVAAVADPAPAPAPPEPVVVEPVRPVLISLDTAAPAPVAASPPVTTRVRVPAPPTVPYRFAIASRDVDGKGSNGRKLGHLTQKQGHDEGGPRNHRARRGPPR